MRGGIGRVQREGRARWRGRECTLSSSEFTQTSPSEVVPRGPWDLEGRSRAGSGQDSATMEPLLGLTLLGVAHSEWGSQAGGCPWPQPRCAFDTTSLSTYNMLVGTRQQASSSGSPRQGRGAHESDSVPGVTKPRPWNSGGPLAMGPPPPPHSHPTSAAPPHPCSGAAEVSWLYCFLHVRPSPVSLHLPKQGCTVALNTGGWAHLQGPRLARGAGDPSHGQDAIVGKAVSGTRCAAGPGVRQKSRSQDMEEHCAGPAMPVSRQDGLGLPAGISRSKAEARQTACPRGL